VWECFRFRLSADVAQYCHRVHVFGSEAFLSINFTERNRRLSVSDVPSSEWGDSPLLNVKCACVIKA